MFLVLPNFLRGAGFREESLKLYPLQTWGQGSHSHSPLHLNPIGFS